MKSELYIGIDPGKSGGIALIERGGSAFVHKMPDTDMDIIELFRSFDCGCSSAMIEQVHSMPGQGVASCFEFGRGFGALIMALVACSIPFERVSPQKWQRAMGCLTKGDKNVSKRKAQEIFPKIKVTHATADALLIAEYARRAGQ